MGTRKPAVVRLALLFLLAGFASATFADTPVTVQQVEQMLTAAHAQSDAKVARMISGLELTERASLAKLAGWQAAFPGKQTRNALLTLADISAFLDLPPSEIPSRDTPTPATQQQILAKVSDYVKKTVHKLPNFSMRRTTTLFEDISPVQQLFNQHLEGTSGASPPPSLSPASKPEPLRQVDRSTRVVTYRDGQEVADARAENDKKSFPQGIVLTTWGEFGPLLSIVAGDAIDGEIFFDHWEQDPSGPLAVFQYSVPQEISHYSLFFGKGDKPQFPAYHGEIAADPANGTVLRLTVVSDLNPPDQRIATAILVEYGPVAIGDVSCICPVKGVALTTAPRLPTWVDTNSTVRGVPEPVAVQPQILLNDVTFTEYRPIPAQTGVVP